jgi:hypothetical protein
MAVGAFGGSFALVQVGALLLVLVAVLALLGRRARAAGSPRSVRLTPHHAVHLVELGGRSFVVGTGPGAAPAMLVELPCVTSEDASPRVGAVHEGAGHGD